MSFMHRYLCSGSFPYRWNSGAALPFLAILLFPPYSSASSQEPTPPCSSPEAGSFDIWIGEWEVRRTDGTLAGENSIRKILNGCVLQDRYTTPTG